MNTEYEGKPLSDRRARRIEQEHNIRPEVKRKKIRRVGEVDEDFDDFDPQDIVKTFNAGSTIDY